MTPMGAIVHGMGGAMEAQTVGMAASQMAQQQAMSQLAGFNGQIKSKDDVTVQYQLVATGQTSPVLQNTLQGKAKSDGVVTPAERAKLQREENRTSRDIYRQKHDEQKK